MANAGIFSQFVKPVRSMRDYANDYDVAEQNKLALAAKRMQMQQAQRGMADADAVRGIAQQYGGDENALIRAYRQGGFLDQAAGIEKSIAERLRAKADAEKTGADTRKSDAETQAKGFELAKNRYNQYRMALGALAGDPALAKEKVIGVAGGLVDAGILTPELAQKLTAALPDEPEALRAYIIAGRDAQLSPELQSKLFAPEFSWQDSGQQKIPVQMNPRAPGYTAPTPIQKVQTPDSLARSEDAAKARAQSAGQFAETKRFQREQFEYGKQKDAQKPAPSAAPAKPMPAAAMRMQDEDLNAIGTFAGIDKDLEGIQKQIETGKLKLGLVGNVTGDIRNRVGLSDENSRNLATFKAKLENMRNSVLLLNKGVQTEGDAQRAMNEMIANINDPEVVKQRLKEIRALNQRAVQLKKNNLDMLRRNYGQEDMDYSKYENQPPATNLPNGNALSPEDAQALEWANKNPSDPRSKAIKQRLGGG